VRCFNRGCVIAHTLSITRGGVSSRTCSCDSPQDWREVLRVTESVISTDWSGSDYLGPLQCCAEVGLKVLSNCRVWVEHDVRGANDWHVNDSKR
jgi:hypothetical protein